jgi:hypothetical protein
MTTEAITYTVPSPAWTGSVDVTLANLLADVTIKDYTLLYNGIEQGTTEKAYWAKTSYTQLTYSGSSLTTNDVVTIRRKTPNTVVQTVTPQSVILSSLWNAEFDRVTRRADEYDTFFNTGSPITGNIVDGTMTVTWDGVTGDAPSKNTIYDLFNTATYSIRPKWTITTGGTLTAATGSTVTLNSGSTLVNNSTTTLNLGSASTLNAKSGSTVTFESGSSVVFDAGAPVTGTVDMDAATSVLIPTVAKATPSGTSTNATNQKWVIDNYHSLVPGGRLCVATGVPVAALGSSTSSTLYYTPFNSDVLWLYNTTDTEWRRYEFTERSITVVGITNEVPYDVFIYDNSGTLTLELVTWTNASTRAASLATQDGIKVKTGSANKLYLGTISTKVANTLQVDIGRFSTDDRLGYLSISNQFNQVTGSYTNQSANPETVNNSELSVNSGLWYGINNGLKTPFSARFNAYGAGASATNLVGNLRAYTPSSGITGTVLASSVCGVNTGYYGSVSTSSVAEGSTGIHGFVCTSYATTAVNVTGLSTSVTVAFTY